MARKMTAGQVREFLLHGTRTAKVATVLADGTPHVVPVWFVLDGDQVVFTAGASSVKARNLRRDPRISLAVDDEQSPYAFVHLRGTATVEGDEALDELRRFATEIGARYMGADRAEEFGQRNAVPGEALIRVTPHRIFGWSDIAGY
jgi:PPOX class probable F420-dependent enzyme